MRNAPPLATLEGSAGSPSFSKSSERCTRMEHPSRSGVEFVERTADKPEVADTDVASTGLTDGELSKLINADRAMLYRWRTGDEPKRPSKRYKEVMKDWEFKGDRWYRRH